MNFGLNFGVMGGGGSEIDCPSPPGELIRNWTFSCDDLYWTPANATATYPNDNCRVVRQGSAGRVQQRVYLQSGEYNIEVEVIATDSSGFVIITPPEGNSDFPIDFIGTGIHTGTFTATVDGTYTIGVGTNNPIGSYCEFGYLSFKLGNAINFVIHNGELVTHNGEPVTWQ